MALGAEELHRRFTYVPPTGTKVHKHEEARSNTLDLATVYDVLLPDSREKSLALTALQEALMWANAAIATNP
jgi:hypothetical protein